MIGKSLLPKISLSDRINCTQQNLICKSFIYNLSSKNPPKAGFFFSSHSSSIPHPEKTDLVVNPKDYCAFTEPIAKGAGEDSFFAMNNALSVADGVGGWAMVRNGNSALYSRLITNNLSRQFKKRSGGTLSPDMVKKAILRCHKMTNSRQVLGSTTLCLCVLNGENLLSANIGDSGFMVLRDGNIILKSKEQLIDFNTPNQLGPNINDTAEYDIYDLKVQEGDIVVLYTDGVSDNLFDYEITEIVKTEKTPKKIAEAVSQKALIFSNSDRVSPFEISARKFNFCFRGGKADDISVVVGVVCENDPNKKNHNAFKLRKEKYKTI